MLSEYQSKIKKLTGPHTPEPSSPSELRNDSNWYDAQLTWGYFL